MINRAAGAFVGIVSMLLVAGGACGGGGSELSLEDYFQQMGAIAQELDKNTSDLAQKYDEDVNAAADEEEALRLTAQFFEDGAKETRAALDKVKKLNPPSQARDEHKEFVAAGEALVALFPDVIQRARDAKSAEDIQALADDLNGPPFSDASNRSDEACFALQKIADDNNIDVDLTCGS